MSVRPRPSREEAEDRLEAIVEVMRDNARGLWSADDWRVSVDDLTDLIRDLTPEA